MRKSSKNTAVVEGHVLYTDDDWTGTQIAGDRWQEWLNFGKTFYYQGRVAAFTVRAEKRRNGFSWYAFKKIDGLLKKQYVGRAASVNSDRLGEVENAWIG